MVSSMVCGHSVITHVLTYLHPRPLTHPPAGGLEPPSPPSPSPSPPLPAPTPPPLPSPPPGYVYQGCFKDSDARRLPVVLAWDQRNMTLEWCDALARAAGVPLYGVQFSWFCFGGNDLAFATSLGPSPNCTMPCGGNSSQVRAWGAPSIRLVALSVWS